MSVNKSLLVFLAIALIFIATLAARTCSQTCASDKSCLRKCAKPTKKTGAKKAISKKSTATRNKKVASSAASKKPIKKKHKVKILAELENEVKAAFTEMFKSKRQQPLKKKKTSSSKPSVRSAKILSDFSLFSKFNPARLNNLKNMFDRIFKRNKKADTFGQEKPLSEQVTTLSKKKFFNAMKNLLKSNQQGGR